MHIRTYCGSLPVHGESGSSVEARAHWHGGVIWIQRMAKGWKEGVERIPHHVTASYTRITMTSWRKRCNGVRDVHVVCAHK